jgi:hypothetical protein
MKVNIHATTSASKELVPLTELSKIIHTPVISNSDLNDTSEDHTLSGMKRKIETTPLIQKQYPSDLDDSNRSEKKITDKKHDNIKNLAQQLQAEREKEDEQLNPNAISKISE